MIPEQAREAIMRRRRLGQSWTSLTKLLEEEYGVIVHRTTVQRWHDREAYSDLGDALLSGDDRIKLDKNISIIKVLGSHKIGKFVQHVKPNNTKLKM